MINWQPLQDELHISPSACWEAQDTKRPWKGSSATNNGRVKYWRSLQFEYFAKIFLMGTEQPSGSWLWTNTDCSGSDSSDQNHWSTEWCSSVNQNHVQNTTTTVTAAACEVTRQPPETREVSLHNNSPKYNKIINELCASIDIISSAIFRLQLHIQTWSLSDYSFKTVSQ